MKEQIQILIDKFIPDERKKAFAHYAREKGYDFRSRAGIDRQDFGIRGFHIIRSKYWNEFKGIVSTHIQEPDTEVRIYDYVGSYNAGQKQTTIIELKCEELDISKFHIQPKSKIKKLKNLFVDPSHDFHDHYSIDSTHTGSIIEELGEDTLDFINSFKGLSIEGDGSYLMIYLRYKKIKIYDLDDYFRFGIELLELILSREVNNDFV